MFLGEFTHAIDDKGRLTIPAKFRERLAEGAVITRGFEKHLLIYTREAFARLTARVRTLTPTDPDHRALLRQQFSGASEVAPDKQGRILVPQFLRDYAGLDGECVLVGVGEFIEVWNRAGWQSQLETINDPVLNAQRFAALKLGSDAPSA